MQNVGNINKKIKVTCTLDVYHKTVHCVKRMLFGCLQSVFYLWDFYSWKIVFLPPENNIDLRNNPVLKL